MCRHKSFLFGINSAVTDRTIRIHACVIAVTVQMNDNTIEEESISGRKFQRFHKQNIFYS